MSGITGSQVPKLEAGEEEKPKTVKKKRAFPKDKGYFSHPPYKEMIITAIVCLKDKNGSTQKMILKHFEDTYIGLKLPPNYRGLVCYYLKTLVASEEVVKLKNGGYVLAPMLSKQPSSSSESVVSVVRDMPMKKPVAAKNKKKKAKLVDVRKRVTTRSVTKKKLSPVANKTMNVAKAKPAAKKPKLVSEPKKTVAKSKSKAATKSRAGLKAKEVGKLKAKQVKKAASQPRAGLKAKAIAKPKANQVKKVVKKPESAVKPKAAKRAKVVETVARAAPRKKETYVPAAPRKRVMLDRKAKTKQPKTMPKSKPSPALKPKAKGMKKVAQPKAAMKSKPKPTRVMPARKGKAEPPKTVAKSTPKPKQATKHKAKPVKQVAKPKAGNKPNPKPAKVPTRVMPSRKAKK